MFKPKVPYTCNACDRPVMDKTPQMACSFCGNGVDTECGVRNITTYSPRQIEWFRRSYRLNPVFYNGRYLFSFCPHCQNVLRTQFLAPLANRGADPHGLTSWPSSVRTSGTLPRLAW
jgi:hypothetical protein